MATDRAQSCTLGWVTDQNVCASLGAKLDQAHQALSQGDNAGARAQLGSFLTLLTGQHGPGLAVNDNAYWLLKVNAEFVLSRIPAKSQDSPAIHFSGGNAWVTVGTWTAAPELPSGNLTALGAAQLWLGLKNSDDIGTNFDVRVEAYKNGGLVAAGQTLCVQGVTRNEGLAKALAVAFAPFSAPSFNGTSDVLGLKVLTRIGTTGAGAACGGHSSAVGVRLYFDAVSRPAGFAVTF